MANHPYWLATPTVYLTKYPSSPFAIAVGGASMSLCMPVIWSDLLCRLQRAWSSTNYWGGCSRESPWLFCHCCQCVFCSPSLFSSEFVCASSLFCSGFCCAPYLSHCFTVSLVVPPHCFPVSFVVHPHCCSVSLVVLPHCFPVSFGCAPSLFCSEFGCAPSLFFSEFGCAPSQFSVSLVVPPHCFTVSLVVHSHCLQWVWSWPLTLLCEFGPVVSLFPVCSVVHFHCFQCVLFSLPVSCGSLFSAPSASPLWQLQTSHIRT